MNMRQNSSVSEQTGGNHGNWRSVSNRGRDFSLCHCIQIVLEPIEPPNQLIMDALSLRAKWQKCEADNPPLCQN